VLKAGYICSAGGKVAAANSNFTPQPMIYVAKASITN
jgi:hypothetical protein